MVKVEVVTGGKSDELLQVEPPLVLTSQRYVGEGEVPLAFALNTAVPPILIRVSWGCVITFVMILSIAIFEYVVHCPRSVQ